MMRIYTEAVDAADCVATAVSLNPVNNNCIAPYTVLLMYVNIVFISLEKRNITYTSRAHVLNPPSTNVNNIINNIWTHWNNFNNLLKVYLTSQASRHTQWWLQHPTAWPSRSPPGKADHRPSDGAVTVTCDLSSELYITRVARSASISWEPC